MLLHCVLCMCTLRTTRSMYGPGKLSVNIWMMCWLLVLYVFGTDISNYDTSTCRQRSVTVDSRHHVKLTQYCAANVGFWVSVCTDHNIWSTYSKCQIVSIALMLLLSTQSDFAMGMYVMQLFNISELSSTVTRMLTGVYVVHRSAYCLNAVIYVYVQLYLIMYKLILMCTLKQLADECTSLSRMYTWIYTCVLDSYKHLRSLDTIHVLLSV